MVDENRLSGVLDCFFQVTNLMSKGVHHYAEKYDPNNIYHGQKKLLTLLKEKGSMNQKELVMELDFQPSSLNELLRNLEARGLVARRHDEQDMSNLIVSITEGGRIVATESDVGQEEIANKIFEVLSETERKELSEILIKLFDYWQEQFDGHPTAAGHGHH
jgi:DNA-binding MarR family transcriptional regulator